MNDQTPQEKQTFLKHKDCGGTLKFLFKNAAGNTVYDCEGCKWRVILDPELTQYKLNGNLQLEKI